MNNPYNETEQNQFSNVFFIHNPSGTKQPWKNSEIILTGKGGY